MKTRLEWFNTMPEPYRSQAIENQKASELTLDDTHDSISDALYNNSFSFLESPQGRAYWHEAANGNFPHAVKESNELRVTKDRVLEAAERCSTTKEALKILFPEAFEDDKSVDLKGIICDSTAGWHGLELCGKSLLWFVPHSGKLLLSNDYKWHITEAGEYIYLIPTKK